MTTINPCEACGIVGIHACLGTAIATNDLGLIQALSEHIAELEKKYADLYLHASALTFGTDWNKGTTALLHGHRQGLIDAVKALKVCM